MNVTNQLQLCLHKKQDQKLVTLHWHLFLIWGREPVSLWFDYKGSQYVQRRSCGTEVNILRLSVGFLNVTRNRNTLNAEPEIWTNQSGHTLQNPWVDRSENRFRLPRCSGLDVWMGHGSNLTIFVVHTPTTGNILCPIANTTPAVTPITLNHGQNICMIIAPNKVTNFSQSLHPSVSLGSIDAIYWTTFSVRFITYPVEVHLQSHSIYAFKYIPNFS